MGFIYKIEIEGELYIGSTRAFQTKEEKIEQIKEKNKIKSNCPICNKQFMKNSINRHIKSKH